MRSSVLEERELGSLPMRQALPVRGEQDKLSGQHMQKQESPRAHDILRGQQNVPGGKLALWKHSRRTCV